ncbi:MAG: energy-coupling factor transporter transmembrane protein EcfT [Chloroflexi bacterium]|nr:energy-coupling factor transporter transmembrane protein EcfT [Chloroflexota bacterium]
MTSYDALRHVAVGQYIPLASSVHRLDPRAKLVVFGLLVVAATLASTYAGSLLMLLVVLIGVRLARLSIRYVLTAVVSVLPFIGVLALLQLLFYKSAYGAAAEHILLDCGPIQVSAASAQAVVVTALRFAVLIGLTSLLTSVTSTSALTQGVERLLRPLRHIGLPADQLALVGSLALRFLPILGETLETIGQAQASREVRPQAGGRWRLAANARRMAALVVPLFVDAYRRAEELGLAMQARCYQGGAGRTHLDELRYGAGDGLAMGLAVALLAAVIWLQRSGV